MSDTKNQNQKNALKKEDLLTIINVDFTPLINMIFKATTNFQEINSLNAKELNQILLTLENNLQSVSEKKINNIKSLLNSRDKSLRTYLNDIKIILNNLLMKSKQIAIQYLDLNQSKSSIDNLILSSEISHKEAELKNLSNEVNYYKNKYNSVNKSYLDSQKIISELKDENALYKEQIIEKDKNLYIQNYSKDEIRENSEYDMKSINYKMQNNEQLSKLENKNKELKDKIKELNNTIEKYESQISKMTDKNSNLSKFLNKKNTEFTQLQSENIQKIEENLKLKNQLEKKINKEKEYQEKINNYQKTLEKNDKIINEKNLKINSMNDNINNDKILIKKLEAEIEQLKFEKDNGKNKRSIKDDNEYINILTDLEKCRKEKEEIEIELENTKKLCENNKKEYKKNIEVMESTIFNNNNIINEKDKIIQELKSKKTINYENDNHNDSNDNNDSINITNENNDNNNNYTGNINVLNREFEEAYKQLSEKDNLIREKEEIIREKEEKINELKAILGNSKKDSKENIIYQKMLQYKNDEMTSQSIIKVLKEQIKNLENENKVLKEESNKKKNNELYDVVEKMLKLEKQIDNYKNKNDNLQKELDKYKNDNNISNPIKKNNINVNEESNLSNLQKQFAALENKYNEEKSKNIKYEEQLEQKKKEISDLKGHITQQKYLNKQNNNSNNIITSNNKNIRYLNDSSNPSFDIEKYNKNLEKLINAQNEIEKLKSKIKELENNKKIKGSLFRCKSIDDDNENFEEEFDMMQIEEGIKKRNRSEDLNIDFPGNNETKKKYQELEERFNDLKEQVVPILKSNANINVTKNNASKICNLLGTSVNTTNNIMEKYNK